MFFSFNSNQSAFELSQFAESAMAVKRVIMQHFSMKYDYMNKERPNIYHPSRSGLCNDEFMTSNSSNPNAISSALDSGAIADYREHTNEPTTDNEYISKTIDTNNYNSHVGNDENVQPRSSIGSNENIDGKKSVEQQQIQNNRVSSATSTTTTTNTTTSTTRPFSNSNALDSIMEMKEKLPSDKSSASSASSSPLKVTQTKDSPRHDSNNKWSYGYSTPQLPANNRTINNSTYNIRPEENWRYRSSSNSMESKNQFGFKSFRNFNNNPCNPSANNDAVNGIGCGKGNRNYQNGIYNNQYPHQQQNQYQPINNNKKKGKNNSAGIDLRNWRNECMYNSARNCGMAGNEVTVNHHSSDSSDSDGMGIGLSPPSESLLMQRRLRMSHRASDIGLRSPLPATASG